jgi:3-hydroxyacyl-CoA dehydrogenase / enoyl-CoA hydratase / 3-hydroxybutyryl-CoA epimerase
MKASYLNWKIKPVENQLVYLQINCPNNSTNVLSQQVLIELDEILEQMSNSNYKTLVFSSLKNGAFIAGADVYEFNQIKNKHDALSFIHFGQKVMNKIAALPMQTIALIDGYCLGGGLELALACDYILLSDNDKVKLGLPEIKLGIHPGYGGSVRSVQKLGVLKAMNLMLTGRTLSAFQAKKMGLVDAIIPQRHLGTCVETFLNNQINTQHKITLTSFFELPFIRDMVAWYLKWEVAKRVNKNHYPAPFQLIDNWCDNYADMQSKFNAEAESASQLLLSATSQNLLRVFQLQERLKKIGHQSKIAAKHVHIMGAGIMGSDIAMWCVYKGFRVSVFDLSEQMLAKMLKQAFSFFSKKYHKTHLVQQAMDNLIPDPGNLGVEKADVLIEAIIEKVSAKQHLFAEVESRVSADCLLVTNTSSIMLEDIAHLMQQPQRLVGLHFFNPVAKMPLIEVIYSKHTSPEFTKKACVFAGSIGKLPLEVTSSPGFLVNRVLMPYILEAMNLVAEGLKPSSIDQAAINFGMPMGPVELADKVGLDICLHVATLLATPLSLTIPKQLQQLVKAGKLGLKSGAGFYHYHEGKIFRAELDYRILSEDEIRDRLMFRFFNEVVACLDEKIVADYDVLDAGIIFGTGFAPFRGGPMHYIRQQGIDVMDHRLLSLSKTYGKRFSPVTGWHQMSVPNLY